MKFATPRVDKNPLTAPFRVLTFQLGFEGCSCSEGDLGMVRARALLLEALVVVAVLAYMGAH